MRAYKAVVTDGVKAFGIPDYIDNDPDAWEWQSGQPQTDADVLYRFVPWIYRAVSLVAGAVDDIPWELQSQRGASVTDSLDYRDKLGYLPNPHAIYQYVARSLLLYGQAYLLKERNRSRILRLRYLAPATMSWEILTGPNGEQMVNPETGKPALRFVRQVNNRRIEYTEQDIIYFWLPDPAVEVGPPTAWPAKAAYMSANVLYNFDDILAKFFKRGMIKPLIVTVDGNPPRDERERIETWFNRLFQGVKNAFRVKVMNAQKLTVQDIASDFKGVSDLAISENARHDIGAAFGIPDALLFSDAANYATATVDRQNFYSQTVIPLLDFIFETLNEQLLAPLALVTNEQTMDVFQKDEAQKSSALAALVAALAQPEAFLVAATILGFDLPDDAKTLLDKLIAKKDENREQMAAQLGAGQTQPDDDAEPEPEPEESPTQKELARWKRSALQHVKRGKAPKAWEPENIPPGQAAAIAAALEGATTSADVVRAFRVEPEPEPDALDEVAARLAGLEHLVKANLWTAYP